MKKILTIIAILFTLSCSASTSRVTYDTTFVRCCKKHRIEYVSGKVVLTKEQWKVKSKKCIKRRVFREFGLWVLCLGIMVLFVNSGMW